MTTVEITPEVANLLSILICFAGLFLVIVAASSIFVLIIEIKKALEYLKTDLNKWIRYLTYAWIWVLSSALVSLITMYCIATYEIFK